MAKRCGVLFGISPTRRIKIKHRPVRWRNTTCAPTHTRSILYISYIKLMSSNNFDPKRLRLANRGPKQAPKAKTKPPVHKPGEKFLKGPIPWKWIVLAARQPGKALHVAIALWFLSGMLKSGRIKLNNILSKTLGVTRYAKHRSLSSLEQAGLISVEQSRGKSPVVTLLDPPEKAIE